MNLGGEIASIRVTTAKIHSLSTANAIHEVVVRCGQRQPKTRAGYLQLRALSIEFIGPEALNKILVCPRGVVWPFIAESRCEVEFIRSAIRTHDDVQHFPFEIRILPDPPTAPTACLRTYPSRFGRTLKGIPSDNLGYA